MLRLFPTERMYCNGCCQSMNKQSPFDKNTVRRSFAGAAQTYDAASAIQVEIGQRLFDNLEYIKLHPSRVIDLGAGTGYFTRQLVKQYSDAHVIGVDFALPMLAHAKKKQRWTLSGADWVCADAAQLPFADASVDIVFSNLMLQWCLPLPSYLLECRRVLNTGGFVMFSSLGPDTLIELRQAWREVDDFEHVSPFMDMHDIGDAMVNTGFADPVLDRELIRLTFPTLKELFHELKAVGVTSAGVERRKGLLSRAQYKRFLQACESFKSEEGLYEITYEAIYCHAWVTDRPAPSQIGHSVVKIHRQE